MVEMRLILRSVLLLVAGAGLPLALTSGAVAQAVQLLGDYRDWSAYSASPSGTNAICFAMSKPTEVTPQPDGYTEGYLYITHRPAENVSNELNFIAGYDFAPDEPATLSVGGQDFQLFTQKDAAWLLDPSQTDTLAGVLRAGTTATIEGTSDKGILVTETFSLSGATAASHAIDGC